MTNDDDTEDFAVGKEANEIRAGYTEMPRAVPEPDDEPKTHGSDRDSMIEASNELARSRAPERDIVDRGYVTVGGEHEGERRPANETVSLEDAASDLARQRALEVQRIEDAENAELAQAVDATKGVPPATDAEVQAWITQQAEQIAAQKAAQQQAVTDNPPPAPSGIDPELHDLLLRNPKAAEALQAEVNQISKAQAQYANAAAQNARLLAASLVADIPEMQGLDSSQFGLALDIVAKSNPQRAADLRARFSKIEHLVQIANQARAQQVQAQTQAEQQRLQAWKQSEEQKWDRWASEPANAQRIQTVMPQALTVLSEAYGLSREQVMHLQRTQPLLNSVAGQQILLDAISYRAAQKTAMQNRAPAPVPPVQRPGVAPARYSAGDGEVDSLRSQFLKSPDAKSAAKFIAARRRAS